MKRTKFPWIIDTIVVNDSEQIRVLSEDPRIDRVFDRHPLLNGLFLRRVLRVLSYLGTRFPHMMPRNDVARASRQEDLWKLFNAKAGRMADGPEELELRSHWVKGEDPETDPGVLVQQIVGSFSFDHYKATGESWEAALTVNSAAHPRNLLKMLWWRMTGKVGRAKRLLAGKVDNDIVFLHGTSIALDNIVASVRKMKALYADETMRQQVTPEEAVDLCLSPPPVVFRQANANGEASGCPFAKYSMLQFRLKAAYDASGVKDMIFMSNGWSRCPAAQWVPAVLAGIWKRALG
jgi:hypothetical protein